MRTWIFRLTIAVALAVAIVAPASAQQTGEITGTVRDSASGQPLPGAQILIPGSRLGTTVNAMGQYTLRNVPAGPTTVRAQRLGYALAERPVTVPAGGSVTVDFTVSARAVLLNKVVAVGYGTQKEEQITSAVSSVDAKDFNQADRKSVV